MLPLVHHLHLLALIFLALDRDNEISPEVEKFFPPYNLILRDVDGAPIYITEEKAFNIGESI